MNSNEIENTIKKYSDGKYIIVYGMLVSLVFFLVAEVVAFFHIFKSSQDSAQYWAITPFICMIVFVIAAYFYPIGTKRLPYSKKLDVEEVKEILEYCKKEKTMNYNYYIDMIHILKLTVNDMYKNYKHAFDKSNREEKSSIDVLKSLTKYFEVDAAEIDRKNLRSYAEKLSEQLTKGRIQNFPLEEIIRTRQRENVPRINITLIVIRFFLVVLIIAIVLKIYDIYKNSPENLVLQLYIQIAPDLTAVYFAYITLKDKMLK